MAREAHRDITVLGASAGGIAVLRALLQQLPADYPAALFVVVHLAPEAPSVLPELLNRTSAIPVIEARDGMPIRRGAVTIAPPDKHLAVEKDRVRVAHGPRENRHRPSIDVLFRSAAVAFGPRATGVILSGMLDDGAAGLWAIKRQGGVAVVQDPRDAEYPDMPRNALEHIKADHVVPISDLGPTLLRVAREPVAEADAGQPPNLAMEVRMAVDNNARIQGLDVLGERTAYTCPECGGLLWELSNGGLRYRCHVGHAYTARTLVTEQTARVEAALWAALRSLEESVRLSQRLASDARARGSDRSAEYHDEMAQANEAHAGMLRDLMSHAPARAESEAAAEG